MDDRMVNELHAIVEELGGEPVLGRSLRTETDLQAVIREGFPQTVVEEVMHAAGLTLKESGPLRAGPSATAPRGAVGPVRIGSPLPARTHSSL